MGLIGKTISLAYDRFLTKYENPSFGHSVAVCKNRSQPNCKAFSASSMMQSKKTAIGHHMRGC